MPVVAEGSTVAEHIRLRRPRSQPIPETDPSPEIPSIIQSTRCKSSISTLLLSTFSNSNESGNGASGGRKKNFTSAKFRGLGCAASSQVSVPAVIRTSADWQAKKVRKKKQKSLPPQQKKSGNKGVNAVAPNPPAASVEGVVPDVWCAPGIGFSADAASVDCVVARRPASGRGTVDGDKINQRERLSCPTRQTANSEHISLHDSDLTIGMMRPVSDVFGPRYYRHVQHRSPEGLAEGDREISMSMATPAKPSPSQVVVLNKAFKLAEQWVKDMSKPLEDEPTEVKLEARPSRLGLGAKVSRQSKIGLSNDPIERKLHAKLDAGKRKSAISMKESTESAKPGSNNSDDSDEDLESRTKSFSKKRVVPPTLSLQRNKKQK